MPGEGDVDKAYLRVMVIEGKIIPKVVKTKGGNTADSLYLKVKLFSGKATFKGVQKAKTEWKDLPPCEVGALPYKASWIFLNFSASTRVDRMIT